MTNEKKNQRANDARLNRAVIESSCTKSAQLKALSHESGLLLKGNKDGKEVAYAVTKCQQLSKLGLEPKYASNGACLGYTPRMFNDATSEDLKEVNEEGKVVANYIYVDRVVRVLVEGAEGPQEGSLYTSEEADKKLKGESAKTIKVYRKCTVSDYGWSPRLLVKTLEQSRNIVKEQERAAKSQEAFEAVKAADNLYVVLNRDGKLEKVHVKIDDVAI